MEYIHRYFYILQNITTGKRYLGVTSRHTLTGYKGSGSKWKDHCLVHNNGGGYGSRNIKLLWCEWVTKESRGNEILDWFIECFGNYWESEEFLNEKPEGNHPTNLHLSRKGYSNPKEWSYKSSQTLQKMVHEGIHPSQLTTPVVDRKGNNLKIPKEEFWNQPGDKNTDWEFVHPLSIEGKRRRSNNNQ